MRYKRYLKKVQISTKIGGTHTKIKNKRYIAKDTNWYQNSWNPYQNRKGTSSYLTKIGKLPPLPSGTFPITENVSKKKSNEVSKHMQEIGLNAFLVIGLCM